MDTTLDDTRSASGEALPDAPAGPIRDGGVLYLQIAETLARSIRAGAMRRGERVPSVRDLARQHGVSLSTATQAYRSLEDARLIEARPRSGYFVAERPRALPEPETSRPPSVSRPVDRSSMSAEVMRIVDDPAFVSFGAACPDASLFDETRLRRALTRAAQRHRRTLAQYRVGPGHETLRRAISRHALRLGSVIEPQQLLVTNGCLEAIVLALRAVTQPGDVVALESPTYFGFFEILEQLHLRALEIPTHPRTGMALDALQLAFDTQPVKAVLVVPTLSNPLGASMPQAERRRLAQMAGQRGIPVIEDVIYNDLSEQDDRRRSVHSFDGTGTVMLCGSFTKTLAPGIRIGWLAAGRWQASVQRMKATTSGGQSTVLELAMADLLGHTGIESGYRRLRATIAARVDEARGIIARHFPRGSRVTDPPGGFILWVEFPRDVDTMALFRTCLDERICFAPGNMFSASERFRSFARLGVGGRWGDAERRALRRIGELASRMIEAGPDARGASAPGAGPG